MRSRILEGGNRSSIRSRQIKAAINNWFWGGSGSSPVISDGILLEDGTSFLQMESGDFFLLE